MYLPPCHRQDNLTAMLELIDANPLGSWVSQGRQGLVANHIPFVLDANRGPSGFLIGHVARGNRVWQECEDGTSAVVMFQGPQAYLTPSWYPGKRSHGKVVPTWNYSVVHVYGTVSVVHEPHRLIRLLAAMTGRLEKPQTQPWKISDAPADFIEKLVQQIVGIEISMDRVEGKRKLAQDEAREDRLGAIEGLQRTGGENAMAMAHLMKESMKSRGEGHSQ